MVSSSAAEDTFDPSARLGDLMFFALDHGIASIDNGGHLVPFVASEAGGVRRLDRIAAEPYERAMAEARTFASKLASSVTVYAIAYDGFITVDGNKYDAIIVHGAERGKGDAYLLAQRYRPAKAGSPIEAIGNPAYLGREPSPLRNAP
jgi:hypothetical protein